jgi:hypothetical protein
MKNHNAKRYKTRMRFILLPHMKKVIISTTAVCAGLFGTAFISCKAVNCVTLTANVSSTSQAYVTAVEGTPDEKTKCEAWKAAMQKWIDAGKCSNVDATTKASYQELVNTTTCN